MRCAVKLGGFVVSGLLWIAVVPLGASERSGATEQLEPSIALDPAIECWYHSQFPVLGAIVLPPEEIVRSRLYFRCSLYPDYYFVDLTTEGGPFHGVAPQAEETCPQVHYYVEALGRDFTSTRTEERVVDVTDENECRRRYPAAAWFQGSEPQMYLGSTVAGPNVAPGFRSIGIAGFITSARSDRRGGRIGRELGCDRRGRGGRRRGRGRRGCAGIGWLQLEHNDECGSGRPSANH